MTPVAIEYASVRNISVAYAWRGSPDRRSPLLFLHGLGDSSIITFERIATHPALQDHSSLLIDLPGFGYSQAPDTWPSTIEAFAGVVTDMCEILRLNHVCIVGHSMGGSVAIQVAARAPEMVSRLILAEPLLRAEQSTLGTSISKRSEDVFTKRGFSMLQLATRRQASRGDIAAESFQEPLSRSNPRIMHRSASSLVKERSPSFYELLATLSIPRIILVGEHSAKAHGTFVPHDVVVKTIPNAGHSMMNENPDAFADAIARVLIAEPPVS